MSEFVTVGRPEDIPSGEGRCIEVNGDEVALFNLDGNFYAIDNLCPHRAGPLGMGEVDGEDVICPWHSWRFNIKTGRSPENSSKVMSYPVKIENGEIKVALS